MTPDRMAETEKPSLLTPGEQIRPELSLDKAVHLIWSLYGLKAEKVKELASYDDRNFFFLAQSAANSFIRSVNEHGYVFKVTNRKDSSDPAFFEAQNEIMTHLSKGGFRVPEPVPDVSGRLLSLQRLDETESVFVVRVLKFLPGKTLYEVDPWTTEHFFQCGTFVAQMDTHLKSFSHPAYETRRTIWSLSNVPELKKFTYAVSKSEDRELVDDIVRAFEIDVVPVEDKLEKGVIHGDFNEQNILMSNSDGGEFSVFGVIDFGDSQKSCLVYDLAITVMYMMTRCKVVDPNDVCGYVLAGYTKSRELPVLEWDVLRVCVAARYAQSLVLGSYTYLTDPGNEYVLITAKEGWRVLRSFWTCDKDDLYVRWKSILSAYS